MKEQFLDDIGLEELIGYIKKYVKDDQDVKPYASYSVFPKTGEQNIIYIDTTNNLTYYWDDTSKTYKALDVQTWDNLSGKPSTFPPSTHNHDDRYYTETEINTKLAGKANSSHTHKKADITDFPTSMPASDVKAWAKADTKPSYSKSEVGLGNVDNTADKDKSVKYATSAGAASSVDWSGVKNKPGTYPPSAHNHNIESLTNFDARVYDAAGTRAANTVLAAPSDSDGTARFRKLVAADLPSHTHNYAGSASAGGAANSSLSLYLNPSTRQTSGDYDMTSSTYACKVTHSVASTIMKTGRPPEDSSVLTFGWDTYAGWGAQLAIGSQKGNHLYVRGANSKQKTVDNKTVNYSEWDSNWRTILDSGNYSSYTVTKTGGGASGNWGINAASASKLTTNAGSSTQPIYFSNGVPVSCAYTLGKSVPSNAVFTDTNTWRPVENSLTSASTSNSLSAAQGKILNELTFQKRNVIDDTVDWDTLKDIGCYKIQMTSWGDANTKHGPNSYSQSLYSFGLLLVFKATDSDGEKRTMQVYFPHQENAGAFNIIMTRMFNNSWWTNWHPIGSGTGWAEILNKPSSYPPSSHTHAISDITNLQSSLDSKLSLSGGTITGQIKRNAGGNWIADRDYAAVFNTLGGGNGYQPVVGQKTATGSWTVGNLGNNESLVFNYCTDANYKTGNNTSEPIYLPAQAGTIITSATIGGQSVNYANSAGKLSTSRTISLTGSVTGSGSFDGSGNLTISTATSHTHNSVADINSGATTTFAYSKAGMGYGDFTWLAAWNGSELRAVNKSLFATTGHTHSYLPLSGGTMGGTAFITWADSGNWSNNNKNVTFPVNRGGLQWNGQSDYVKLFTQETGQDNLELVLQFGDDNSNGLSIRNNVGSETARITSTGVFTGTFSGNLSGKASTAGTADVANSVAWSNVSGKPGTFTPSSHTHTNIVSRGRKNPCASGTTGNNADAEVNVTGLSLTEAYNASTPTSFGNIINVIGAGAGGAGQLFLGWSGADSVTEHLYYRSHRDVNTGGWGPWRTVAFTTDNVASADTLTSNAGSATQPIYFSGGKPVACSYSLSKSVPSNAVFTDTNTWRGCQNNLTSTATDQSLSAAQGKWLNENKLNAINTNGYWGMATPSGNSGDWIRTTSAGIIPYQPGGINSSHCGLGTSSWYFNYAYITTVYGNLSGNASTASKLATARTVSGGTDITMNFNYDGSGNSSANIEFYNCSAYVSNTNNYPFHRFAKLDVIPASWADRTTTFYVSQDFNGGAFGIFRISLKTNNVSNKELSSAEVVWLVRYGIPADAIQIGLYNVAGATYADAFIKTQGSYYSTVFRAIANGVRGSISRTWTLINSSENGNTSSSDKKGSYECYASVAAAGTALHNKSYTNIVSGSDVGNVSTASYANSAGNATQWNGRTLDIGTEAGSDAGWLLIDNGGIVRHRSASYFATAGHTHNYLPLSGGTMTGNINYTTCGNSYIGNGQQDNAEGPGGKLNNLVIGSWWGVSFTTPCSGQTYSGKTAVGIDCREGIIKAARVNANSFNGYTINASVPSGAKFTDTNTWRGIQNNLSSDSTTDSLSAAQGKRLKELVDEKTDIHNLNYGIKFSSSSMNSNGSQNTLYPAKYENGAYSKTTGVSTYANRNNTIHIGTSANMFGDICLAGGITSLGVYNVTTTTNIPVSVTSQGYLRRYKSGSSLMIKNHIYKIGYDEAKELLNTNVYSFRYNDDGQPANGKEHAAVNRYGFVLEDMEKTFPMAVEYDENGLPAAWCVQIIVPTILEIVKHQQAEISSLKAENKELKEKISEIDKLKKSLDELRELITNK